MTSSLKILIADDDESILLLLRDVLIDEGWQVVTYKDGASLIKAFKKEKPHLIISDIKMPEISGFELCKQIRKLSNVPIIFLSACYDEKDRVSAFKSGADDYITKPFCIDEVILRIRAIVKRCYNGEHPPIQPRMVFGDVILDTQEFKIFVKDNEIPLSNTEFNIIFELYSNYGKTVKYTTLLKKIWGSEYKYEINYLHVYISRLRRKLNLNLVNTSIISIPRIGYRLRSLSDEYI